jgi:hypothetical protein
LIDLNLNMNQAGTLLQHSERNLNMNFRQPTAPTAPVAALFSTVPAASLAPCGVKLKCEATLREFSTRPAGLMAHLPMASGLVIYVSDNNRE